MPKELHPYLFHFDNTKKWKYLIIGTFPPNKEIRQGKKSLTDYFYGNKGSLWKILGQIYTECDFQTGTRDHLIEKMKAWQDKYSVGITDTLKSVSRKALDSANDSDLIIDWEDYNHDLKTYIIENIETIEKILFTSNSGCNSALQIFKIIMGEQFSLLLTNKLITDLPSPSGSSNTAWFNVNTHEHIGLHHNLFNYIQQHRPELLSSFEARWTIKKQKLNLKGEQKKTVKVPSAYEGIVTDFKIFKYKEALPQQVQL